MNMPVTQETGAVLEQVIIGGDLSRLKPDERVLYYNRVCQSLGLNPLTQPFSYIRLQGKETLYAKRDATEQLRKINGVSIRIVAREVVEDCYVVTAQATDKTGRTDESIGAVPIKGLTGEARSNALMKCETKAKRRVTLSICGLGLLDESEVDSVPDARITPSAGALESLSVNDQGIVVETAQQIKSLAANDQMMDAYTLWQDSRFDADQTVALFSLLPTKVKNLLGSMRDNERAQEKGTISPQQKKRLEAIIKEHPTLDRESVKAECVKRFGVEHFQDLTREQYDELIAAIQDSAPPPNPPSASAESPATVEAGALPDGGLLTKEQIQEIEVLLEMKGINKSRFLTIAKVKSVDQIQANRFRKAIEWLDKQEART